MDGLLYGLSIGTQHFHEFYHPSKNNLRRLRRQRKIKGSDYIDYSRMTEFLQNCLFESN
jgi:hypothetical protein